MVVDVENTIISILRERSKEYRGGAVPRSVICDEISDSVSEEKLESAFENLEYRDELIFEYGSSSYKLRSHRLSM